jgi:hypothetical protein
MDFKNEGITSIGKSVPLNNPERVANIQLKGSPCLKRRIIPADIIPIPDREAIEKNKIHSTDKIFIWKEIPNIKTANIKKTMLFNRSRVKLQSAE